MEDIKFSKQINNVQLEFKSSIAVTLIKTNELSRQ